MENESPQVTPNLPDMSQQYPPEPPKSGKGKKVLIIVIIAAAVLALAVYLLTLFLPKPNNQPTNDTKNEAVTNTFYEALGNAAQQQKLRVSMYRETYANKADADAKANKGSQQSSIVELDTQAGKLRAVYANNLTNVNEFTIGRCMDGTTYSDDYFATKSPRPATLEAASNDLNAGNHIYRVTQALIFIPCPHVGIIQGAIPDLAAFRLSDGVFPVTFSAQQAENWKSKVKAANLFTVKDEGRAEFEGKQLRKISFTPNDQETVNKQLYTIFYETGEIDRIKAENPKAEYNYEFISVNPINTGSVGGYYLVDEQTKLPVYSELYGINPDKKTGESSSAGKNISRTKQKYSFGQPLSLELTTPLEFLR